MGANRIGGGGCGVAVPGHAAAAHAAARGSVLGAGLLARGRDRSLRRETGAARRRGRRAPTRSAGWAGPRAFTCARASSSGGRWARCIASGVTSSNLARFLRHVERVDVLDARRSHWVVRGPGNMRLEWDAEILSDEPDALLSWKSTAPADIVSAGSVIFRPLGSRADADRRALPVRAAGRRRSAAGGGAARPGSAGAGARGSRAPAWRCSSGATMRPTAVPPRRGGAPGLVTSMAQAVGRDQRGTWSPASSRSITTASAHSGSALGRDEVGGGLRFGQAHAAWPRPGRPSAASTRRCGCRRMPPRRRCAMP